MILGSITGVGPRAAEAILAEIGPDMSRFPTAGHLASWAGRCPGQWESGGKRGAATPRLADVLTECAWAAVKTKGTYLAAYYRQPVRRQGKQTAAVHRRPLRRSGCRRRRTSTTEQQRRRAIRQLEALGLSVTVTPRTDPGAA
jgi:transposase